MGKQNDSLGNRMKEYESVSRHFLTRRIPAIIRLDGKAFHTFTRGMKKPFDRIMMTTMQETMKFLCENIQGCVFGYTQSDEITLVLTDYATIATDGWFGYNIQKMVSVSASMATQAFNRIFKENAEAALQYADTESSIEWCVDFDFSKYEKKFNTALFDSRVFSLPKDEVCNCLIWRQQDATRNSIESVGQANFSQKQLNGKSCNEIREMLWSEKGINWNDFQTDCKRGSCCYRVVETSTIPDPRNDGKFVEVSRRRWVIDNNIPIFTKDRNFVERWL